MITKVAATVKYLAYHSGLYTVRKQMYLNAVVTFVIMKTALYFSKGSVKAKILNDLLCYLTDMNSILANRIFEL